MQPDPAVRLVRPDELNLLFPASVAMYTEEVGVSPLDDQGGARYRQRVGDLINMRRAYARFIDGQVVFKADLAVVTRHTAQVQGVWVHPDYRGKGLAIAGMAAVVRDALRRVAPTVSLYVNDYNTPARRVYARCGFAQVGHVRDGAVLAGFCLSAGGSHQVTARLNIREGASSFRRRSDPRRKDEFWHQAFSSHVFLHDEVSTRWVRSSSRSRITARATTGTPARRRNGSAARIAIAAGVAVYLLLHLLTHGTLLAAVVGTSVAAAIAGLNFGRRDSRELARFAELAKTKPVRRQTALHTGRAVWRGMAEGTGGAAAAVIIVNLRQRGVLADWLLPLVPAIVGALAHQIGGMYEHLGTSKSTEGRRSGPRRRPLPDCCRRADGCRPGARRPSGAIVTAAPAMRTRPPRGRARCRHAAVATIPLPLGTARVSSLILSAAGKLQQVGASDANEPATVLRFDPVADCGTVARARGTTALARPAKVKAGTPACPPVRRLLNAATVGGGTAARAGAAPAAAKTAGLSLHHAAGRAAADHLDVRARQAADAAHGRDRRPRRPGPHRGRAGCRDR